MRDNYTIICKAIITLLCIDMWIWDVQIGYSDGSQWWTHIIYMLCHANIFHLAGNLLCLMLMRPKLHAPAATLIAIAATFLPSMTDYETIGLSGMLFAMSGIKWGQYGNVRGMMKYCVIITAITILIPNVNWCIHLYCAMIGCAYGWTKNKWNRL